MILDKKTIDRLNREGIKLTGTDGKPVAPQRTITPRKQSSELDYLRIIANSLEQLLARPTPTQTEPTIAKPPNVIVNPPEVIVNIPELNIPPQPPRFRKWKFVLEKDFSGHTTEIIATALE